MVVLFAYLPDTYEMDLTQSPDELRRLYLLRYHVRRHSLLRHPDHHLGETQITLYCASAEQSDPKKGNNDQDEEISPNPNPESDHYMIKPPLDGGSSSPHKGGRSNQIKEKGKQRHGPGRNREDRIDGGIDNQDDPKGDAERERREADEDEELERAPSRTPCACCGTRSAWWKCRRCKLWICCYYCIYDWERNKPLCVDGAPGREEGAASTATSRSVAAEDFAPVHREQASSSNDLKRAIMRSREGIRGVHHHGSRV